MLRRFYLLELFFIFLVDKAECRSLKILTFKAAFATGWLLLELNTEQRRKVQTSTLHPVLLRLPSD